LPRRSMRLPRISIACSLAGPAQAVKHAATEASTWPRAHGGRLRACAAEKGFLETTFLAYFGETSPPRRFGAGERADDRTGRECRCRRDLPGCGGRARRP
jgi:hypothetical protein